MDPSYGKLDKKGLTSQISLPGLDALEIWSHQLAEKLAAQGRAKEAAKLADCQKHETFCHCLECGHVQTWTNHCDLFYCPRCAARISWKRRKALSWWSAEVPHPLHMVLTVRNRATLTKVYVQWFQSCHRRLRRSKFAASWRGGLTSLELTNESKGWHLHSHSLVDHNWIDGGELARQWSKIVSQDIAIVKVKAVTGAEYLHEVTKYAVKGSQSTTWSGPDLESWIDAFEGVRSFSTWGRLYKDKALRAKISTLLESEPWECPHCGKSHCRVLDTCEEEYFQTFGKFPTLSY